MDDDYTFVNFTGSHHWSEDGEGVAFLGSLGSNVSPYGQADFLIKCPVGSSSFELLATYDKQSPNTGIDVEQFVNKHFSRSFQRGLKIHLRRECSNRGNCKMSYSLNTTSLTFDMIERTIDPINLHSETFHLDDKSGHRFYFNTDFLEKKTSIRFISPSQRFVIGEQDTIEIDSEKFLRFPLDHEFLLNKVKTLLLFS